MADRDYHIHTCFSSDSSADPYEIAEAAVSRGLKAICFTDHTDIGYNAAGTFTFDPDAYFSALSEVREHFRDRLEVRIGVELGLIPDDPEIAARIRAFAASRPWEFIIGSTHLMPAPAGTDCEALKQAFPSEKLLPPDAPLLDPWDPGAWRAFGSTRAMFTAYYETVLKNVRQFSPFDQTTPNKVFGIRCIWLNPWVKINNKTCHLFR